MSAFLHSSRLSLAFSAIAIIAGYFAAYFAGYLLVKYAITPKSNQASPKLKALREVISSPRQTLIPQLTSDQAKALPYPPDLMPGARDVDTPFGMMRVYEWGLSNGRKVIFVHGDTSPAPLLALIAKALAAKGCRVMLFGMSLYNHYNPALHNKRSSSFTPRPIVTT